MATSNLPNGFTNDLEYPIAIVGGGLAGLALAIGLQKHGIEFHIYESARCFSEVGAGIAFGINSLSALQLIDDRLLEGYKKHATFNDDPKHEVTFLSLRYGMDPRNGSGAKSMDLMWHLKDGWAAAEAKRLGVRIRSCIHRAKLLDELVELLPEGVTSFGKNFQEYKELADGTLELRFGDGTTVLASAVIGCDGVKSKVREAAGLDIRPSYVGEYAYRALIPRPEAEKALGAELVQNGQLYCGYGAHIVSYPVEHGAFTNMVAVPHDPDSPGSWDAVDWTAPATQEDVARDFEGWDPVLIELFQKYCQPAKWRLFNTRHSSPYFKGRVCLMGDSAHATTPTLGAGAGMAMEDAYVLSNLIAAARHSSNIEEAFRVYDTVRRPRTQQLIEDSRHASLAVGFVDDAMTDDVEKIRDAYEGWYRRLWHVDLEKQLDQARLLL